MWIYVPSTLSASAPAAEVSTLESNWQCQTLAASVSWRGKHSPARNWLARCSKVSWLKRLFGVMSPRSTVDHGVESWMASLAVSRASPIPLPGSAAEKMTNATFGATRGESSSSRARGSSLSKTSRECFRPNPALIRARYGSGVIYSDWVSTLREDCLRRQKSAQAMRESASLSSEWQTPAADSFRSRGGDRREEMGLDQQARFWPTPTLPAPHDSENTVGMGMNNQFDLAKAAIGMWPTPKVINGGANSKRDDRGAGGPDLQEFAQTMWPTPSTRDYKGANSADHLENGTGRKHMDQLPNFVEHLWSTPRSSDGEKGSPNQAFGAGGVPLAAQSVQWATPRSHEVGDYQYSRGDKTKPVATLTGQASFHPAQATYPVGGASSKERRSLNPLFVEWLMGWPPGWTLLAWTGFACSETELFHYKRRMRSELLRLGSPQAAPPAQLGLFA